MPANLVPGGQTANQVLAADFNLDGKVDLVMSSLSTAQLLYGNGDGTFGTAVAVSISGFSIVSADFDRDGAPDLGEATANKGVPSEGVLLNTQ